MKVINSGRKSIVHLALVFALIAAVSACQAQSNFDSAPSLASSLDKHARKIHKRIAGYPTGTYLNVVLRDGSDGSGALDGLSSASFTVTDTDSNVRATHLYSEVASVSKGKEYIGEGSEPGHHIHVRLWVPIAVGIVAAGAAATATEVR